MSSFGSFRRYLETHKDGHTDELLPGSDHTILCDCGNIFYKDAQYCRRCGKSRAQVRPRRLSSEPSTAASDGDGGQDSPAYATYEQLAGLGAWTWMAQTGPLARSARDVRFQQQGAYDPETMSAPPTVQNLSVLPDSKAQAESSQDGTLTRDLVLPTRPDNTSSTRDISAPWAIPDDSDDDCDGEGWGQWILNMLTCHSRSR